MKRATFVFALILFLTPTNLAQHEKDNSATKHEAEKPTTFIRGLGSHRHPVSTTNAEAQRFFDQGLTLVFAFNHEAAIRAFKRAAQLDPKLAMAHWGIALALGPNINLDVDPEREKAAYDAVQRAVTLAANASENERAYINVLAKRYSIDPNADLKKLAVDYRDAMGELVKQYPDDLDAATLYAESGMNLRPWQLWTKDGKPAEGTKEIVVVLESVLRRKPDHIGAIHYYIHAIEASPNPEKALPYVAKLPASVPAAGHLVHMPAHIYMRIGDYAKAALSNKDAAQADEAFFKLTGSQGLYPVMYYNHNLHFLAIAYGIGGQFTAAMRAAQQLENNVGPHVQKMPMLEGFMTTSTFMLVRFRRWGEILKLPKAHSSMPATKTVQHFARGMAYAANGKVEDASNELNAFVDARKTVPAEAAFGLNSAANVLQIAEDVLKAKIAVAKHDNSAALISLRKAIVIEDSLAYDEPPGWFLPVRESLGGLLMSNGDYSEAEATFRADLERNPLSGRSLFGLMNALKAQRKARAAGVVRRQFINAWKNADVRLKLGDL